MKRESFIFYKSFYDSIKELAPKEQAQIYNAIFEYQFENKNPELKNVCKSIFTLILPQLEANNKRYENGKRGGRPKQNQNETETKPKQNQNETENKPNDNDNVNVNEKDNDNNIYSPASPAKAEQNIPYKEIIDYLNFKLQSNYKDTTRKTRDLIKARYNENFKLDDFKKVIDNKCEEWLNTEMQKYLRPETLFGSKFESYLNQQNKSKYNESIPDWFDKNVETKETSNQDIKELEELLKDFN